MMTNNYPKALLSNFNGDYGQAYEYLSKVYLSLEKQFSGDGSSRFIDAIAEARSNWQQSEIPQEV